DAIRLLDRAELRRVMAEQKLTATLATKDAMRLGQLLAAEGMLIVRPMPEEGPVQAWDAQLVATRPGVVLWSIVAPAHEAAQWSGEAARRTGNSLAKLDVEAGTATAIALL